MRAYIVCVVVAILGLFFLQDATAQNHSMEWGSPRFGDRMVFWKNVAKKHNLMRVVTQDVYYAGIARISYIKAMDQYKDGHGGYASVREGGVGYYNVTIHLKSQHNHGFNFTIEIYGQ